MNQLESESCGSPICRLGMWEMRYQSSPFPLLQRLSRSGQERISSSCRAVRPVIHSGKALRPRQLEISSSLREVVRRHRDWGRQVMLSNLQISNLRSLWSLPKHSGSSRRASHPPISSFWRDMRLHKDWGRQVRAPRPQIFNLCRLWSSPKHWGSSRSASHPPIWSFLRDMRLHKD
jgi:hypothetical protein